VEFYRQEAKKAGRRLRLDDNVGLARLVALGKTHEEALYLARQGSPHEF